MLFTREPSPTLPSPVRARRQPALPSRVHQCTDAGKTAKLLASSHFFSLTTRRSGRHVRSTSHYVVMVSVLNREFSDPQENSWESLPRKVSRQPADVHYAQR